MWRSLIAVEHDRLWVSERCVKLAEFGEALRGHLLGPVIGGRHTLGLGSKERREVNVPLANAEQGRIFAGATPLHRRRHHHGGEGERDPFVERCQHHRLSAATTRAGRRHAGRVDVGEGQYEVDAPQCIPGLQSHHRLQAGFRGRAVEAPRLWVIHLGTCLGEPMDYFGRELQRVGVTERIPLPDDAAHAG